MKTTYTDKAWIKHELAKLDVTVGYDENYYGDDEFFHSDLVKIDIMPHRHYEFLHELDLKREYLENEYEEDDYYYEDWLEEQKRRKKICEDNYVFGLDFFEHSSISFSLVEKRIDLGYYERDRSRNVGYIVVEKWNLSYSEAMKIAEATLDDYNNYINWRLTYYSIRDNEKDECYDSCHGFYQQKDAEAECINTIEWYLKNQWIEFTKVEIE